MEVWLLGPAWWPPGREAKAGPRQVDAARAHAGRRCDLAGREAVLVHLDDGGVVLAVAQALALEEVPHLATAAPKVLRDLSQRPTLRAQASGELSFRDPLREGPHGYRLLLHAGWPWILATAAVTAILASRPAGAPPRRSAR
jgi:hypothetical protein